MGRFMSSPAERMVRLLTGVSFCLFLALSFAILDNRTTESDPMIGAILGVAAVICGSTALFINSRIGTLDVPLFTDRWFSREETGVMAERLRKEIEDSDVERMGASWARYEMEHLEGRHEEE